MENKKAAKGACLCGSIKVSTSSMDTNLGVCHCNMCRKWSAGPFTAIDCGTDLKIEDENNYLKTFNSSEWAERGFCSNCGTSLFYKLKEQKQFICSSEIFEESNLVFDHQIFIEEKPDYYSFANQTKNMTGAEVFAAYAPQESE